MKKAQNVNTEDIKKIYYEMVTTVEEKLSSLPAQGYIKKLYLTKLFNK